MTSFPRLRRPAVTICGLVLAAQLACAGSAWAQSSAPASEKFGDWALACRVGGDKGPERCVLAQNIVIKQSSKRVLNISIARPAPDRPYIAAVTAPLGILLAAGLVLQVDEKELVRFPLQICNVNGCQGQFPITDEIRRTIAEGSAGKVVIRQPNGQPLGIQFSLKGFGEGMQALVAK